MQPPGWPRPPNPGHPGRAAALVSPVDARLRAAAIEPVVEGANLRSSRRTRFAIDSSRRPERIGRQGRHGRLPPHADHRASRGRCSARRASHDPVAGPATESAIAYLAELFGRRGGEGIQMATRALRLAVPETQVTALNPIVKPTRGLEPRTPSLRVARWDGNCPWYRGSVVVSCALRSRQMCGVRDKVRDKVRGASATHAASLAGAVKGSWWWPVGPDRRRCPGAPGFCLYRSDLR
jgi:hypothetical protein